MLKKQRRTPGIPYNPSTVKQANLNGSGDVGNTCYHTLFYRCYIKLFAYALTGVCVCVCVPDTRRSPRHVGN